MDHPQFICSALCILTILQSSLAVDTLSPNQTLDDGKVLVSPGKMFELGFFSPGKSTTRFLGIWYRATPDVVVWVANRNAPIMDSRGVLTLAENGTLVLTTTNQGSKIWSSDPSRPASSPALQLLDTGNLVLVDYSSNIWQSFDHPTDTRLPGMKIVQDPETGVSKYLTSWKSADDPSTGQFSYRIENLGLSQLVIMEKMEKRFRTVFWNGYFHGIPFSQHQVWNEVESRRGMLISVLNPSKDIRLTMNYSGIIQRFMMTEEKDGWNLLMGEPRDSCDKYGWCGNNSICKINKTPECECLRGFKPKSEREWGIFEWRSGCYRNLSLDCQKEDGFLRVEGIKFPDSLNFRLNTSMSFDECRDECLKNCNCTAYADPYSNNESSCLMWFGDLIDIKEQDEDPSAKPIVYIRVPCTPLTADKKTREELELPLFDFATIAAATNNFTRENLIGEGGFGPWKSLQKNNQ